MLPNKKTKKSKLKEKSKVEIKVTKDKIMKKKKKSTMAVQELIKNKTDVLSSVVDHALIKMNNVDPKVLAKKHKAHKLKSKVIRNEEEKKVDVNDHRNTDMHDTLDCGKKLDKEKKSKVSSKKRNNKKENVMLASGEDQIHVNEDDNDDGINMHAHANRDVGARLKKKRKEKNENKAKKMKCRKKDIEEMQMVEAHSKTGESEVDEISLVDEDCSRGMKKWLAQYKEKRPGLNILQQRIDDYIASYEERLEQERKEREAKLDEEGWTIVKHHKGRKKTTDAESGVSVGSVAQAAMVDKLNQKKSKEAPLNFYRHQRREENRNEIMKLQSKFEEDKRRVQEMKAARKFRPY